jgi:hypothetical protein
MVTCKEKKMTKKKIWLGMLAVVLVFGMTVVGCEDEAKKDCTVTFDANGGNWSKTENGNTVTFSTKSVTVPGGTSWEDVGAFALPNPTKTGSTFSSWNPTPPGSTTIIGNPNRIDEDITLYASWNNN